MERSMEPNDFDRHKKSVSHWLHIIICLITGGSWLIVWLLVTIHVNSYNNRLASGKIYPGTGGTSWVGEMLVFIFIIITIIALLVAFGF